MFVIENIAMGKLIAHCFIYETVRYTFCEYLLIYSYPSDKFVYRNIVIFCKPDTEINVR